MLRMLGHVTQNHALSRLGEFMVVNTVATGLNPLGRNSNGWDQASCPTSKSHHTSITGGFWY